MHYELIGSLRRCRLVSFSRGGKFGCFINRNASNFFSCSYDVRTRFKNLLSVLSFLLIVLFCILLQKCFLIWVTFRAKLRRGTSCRVIFSLFKVFILIHYLLWCGSLILLSGEIKTNAVPISRSGQCFSNCYWNLNSITAHN